MGSRYLHVVRCDFNQTRDKSNTSPSSRQAGCSPLFCPRVPFSSLRAVLYATPFRLALAYIRFVLGASGIWRVKYAAPDALWGSREAPCWRSLFTFGRLAVVGLSRTVVFIVSHPFLASSNRLESFISALSSRFVLYTQWLTKYHRKYDDSVENFSNMSNVIVAVGSYYSANEIFMTGVYRCWNTFVSHCKCLSLS